MTLIPESGRGSNPAKNELDQIANHYGVTSELMRRQLTNHGIATVSED